MLVQARRGFYLVLALLLLRLWRAADDVQPPAADAPARPLRLAGRRGGGGGRGGGKGGGAGGDGGSGVALPLPSLSPAPASPALLLESQGEHELTRRWAAAAAAAAEAAASAAAASASAPAPLPASVPAACAATVAVFNASIARSLRKWPAGSFSRADLAACGGVAESRVVLFGGAVYYRQLVPGYHERPGSMLRVLLRAAAAAEAGGHFGAGEPPPPDTELLLAGRDLPGPRQRAPVLNACEEDNVRSGDVAVPDMAFARWGSAGIFGEGKLDYADIFASIVAESAATPYAARQRVVLFRGGLLDQDRLGAVSIFIAHPHLFDAALRDSPPPLAEPVQGHPIRTTSLVNFSHAAVNLYMAGNGYSSRLKYLLLAGSPVIILGGTERGAMREFYTTAMTPYVHYVPATHGTLAEAAAWLLDNPAIAESIGQAGSAWARTHLNPRAVSCWWRVFLHAYTARLSDPPVAPPPGDDFVPITTHMDLDDLNERFGHYRDKNIADRKAAALAGLKA